MKTGAIIQARTSSTRLPGKVLKELPSGSGITALAQVIRRVKKARNLDETIVATSAEKPDDAIAEIAQKEGAKVFRGSLHDVLSRYYSAAKKNSLDVIVRITSDCPCIDPDIIDQVVAKHHKERADYTSNVLKKTYADGLDVEVVSFPILEKLDRSVKDAYEREHPTFYIHCNQSLFKIADVVAVGELYAPHVRITLDTEKDYEVLSEIFAELYPQNPYFNAKAVMKFFRGKKSAVS